jgi:hypothetical protein
MARRLFVEIVRTGKYFGLKKQGGLRMNFRGGPRDPGHHQKPVGRVTCHLKRRTDSSSEERDAAENMSVSVRLSIRCYHIYGESRTLSFSRDF